MTQWQSIFYDLIVRTSTDLPEDVEARLRQCRDSEDAQTGAPEILGTILENVDLARASRQPICQDTGSLLFWIETPAGVDRKVIRQAAEFAIAQVTAEGVLRQNSIETLSGKNSGNNLGAGSPVIHWEDAEGDTVKISLVLKGGGCENVGIQYSLPDSRLDAGRDLEGVRRCLLDAAVQAQGKGCAPGILGVAIGGDRATGYAESKRQLLRMLGQRSPQPELADLERRVLAEANSLGIGPMGLGGKTTLLDVFVGVLNRLPASYFVSVSYMCWACRRRQVEVSLNGKPV
jgi:fumarate hydratase class I